MKSMHPQVAPAAPARALSDADLGAVAGGHAALVPPVRHPLPGPFPPHWPHLPHHPRRHGPIVVVPL